MNRTSDLNYDFHLNFIHIKIQYLRYKLSDSHISCMNTFAISNVKSYNNQTITKTICTCYYIKECSFRWSWLSIFILSWYNCITITHHPTIYIVPMVLIIVMVNGTFITNKCITHIIEHATLRGSKTILEKTIVCLTKLSYFKCISTVKSYHKRDQIILAF